MPTSDPIDILLEHDRWATRNMIDVCATLTPEQFHQRFEMGPGSLHDTTTHILAAMRVWEDVLAGREPRPRLEGTKRTLAELLALHEESASAFAAVARKYALDETVTRERRDGQKVILSRAGVIAHVATHGMHHRAQCLNMLRQLGVKPLPHSSVVEWMRMADPKR
jgi:uncharacterized damage-inducible protein DinB